MPGTDFITSVSLRINQVGEHEQPSLSVLVRLESRLAVALLKSTLADFSTKQANNAVVTDEMLKPLINRLSERWKEVRLTDAVYCHAPDSRANKMYLALAEEIAKVTGKHAYDYLMPTVKASECRTSKMDAEGKPLDLHALQLHEFIFADSPASRVIPATYSGTSTRNLTLAEALSGDVGEPVEIFQCLEAAESDVHRELKKTCVTHTALNDKEVMRVKGHSDLSRAYYVAIKTRDNIEGARESLKNAIQDAANYEVKSSYGPEGEQRLLAVILSTCKDLENKPIKDLEKFADLLTSYIPRDEWGKFFEKINSKKLTELVFGASVIDCRKFEAAVKNSENYYRDQRYNAAVLYCFAFVYKVTRDQEPQRKTYLGWMFNEYDKQEKLDAVNLLLAYLASGHTQTLEAFHKKTPCMDGVTDERRWGAINNGLLGSVAKSIQERIKVVASPASSHTLSSSLSSTLPSSRGLSAGPI